VGRHFKSPSLRRARWGYHVANAAPKPVGKSEFEEIRMKAHRKESSAQADLLRDIFGNPYQPVVVEQHWLTPDVVAHARHIYAQKAFDQMPALADALTAVGCDATAILDHCRERRDHVRGCWVLDLILEKEQPLALTPIATLEEWARRILNSDSPLRSIESELSRWKLSGSDSNAIKCVFEDLRKQGDTCEEQRIIDVLDWVAKFCPPPWTNGDAEGPPAAG
jgi:hypothetical protein